MQQTIRFLFLHSRVESLCALWIFSASFGVTEFLPDGDRTPTHIETIKMLV